MAIFSDEGSPLILENSKIISENKTEKAKANAMI